MKESSPIHSYYLTPPSLSKKKAIDQLQNAPNSRKGQSTLDTSPDKKSKCIEECMPQTKGPEFQQELFNLLLNECESKPKEQQDISCTQEIHPQCLSDFAMEFSSLFNSRDKRIIDIFSSSAYAISNDSKVTIVEFLYNLSSCLHEINTSSIVLEKAEKTMEGYMIMVNAKATNQNEVACNIHLSMRVSDSLKINSIELQILAN